MVVLGGSIRNKLEQLSREDVEAFMERQRNT